MTTQSPLSRSAVLIALVVAIAQFMQMLDAAAISIALPPMARDFGVSPVSAGLGITVYVLAASIFIPTSGWLADRIGARTVFIGSLAAFTLASVLCGLSTNLWQFIAARALQGMTGALMAPVGQLIVLRSVERSQLLRIMNLTSAPMLLAPVIGPPLGGLLATWFGWQWIFFINLPAGILAIALAMKIFPNLKGERRPFDLTGFVLNAAALTPLLWGLSEMGAGGASRRIAIGAMAAGLAIGVLALRHAARADHPLVSSAPLRHPTFRLSSGWGILLIRLPITAIIFVLPIMLQAGFGMTAFLVGLLFLGHSGGDLGMKLFTTRVFARFGYRTVLIVSTLGMAVFIAAAAGFTSGTSLALIFAVLFVSGSFRSFLMTGLSTLTFADIEPAEMPSASTLSQVVMQLSTALGVSGSSFLLGLSRTITRSSGGAPTPDDCRLTLVVMSAMALIATPLFLRLARDAGSELSGHRPGAKSASA